MANGVIAVYDTSKLEEGGLLFRSEISEFFHIDRVTSLEWCVMKVNKNQKIILASAGLDGKLLFWDVADKLKYPKRGYILCSRGDTSSQRSHYSGMQQKLTSKRTEAKTLGQERVHCRLLYRTRSEDRGSSSYQRCHP